MSTYAHYECVYNRENGTRIKGSFFARDQYSSVFFFFSIYKTDYILVPVIERGASARVYANLLSDNNLAFLIDCFPAYSEAKEKHPVQINNRIRAQHTNGYGLRVCAAIKCYMLFLTQFHPLWKYWFQATHTHIT